MKVQPRVHVSNVNQFIYPSSAPKFAQAYGGLLDQVTGACWLSTVDGVRELKYNDWIVTSDDGVRIMPRAQVLAQFQPLDWDEAYDMLGSTDWPGRPSNPTDDSPMSTYPDNEAMYVVRSVSDDGMVYATPADTTGAHVSVMAGPDGCYGFEPIADVAVTFRLTREGAYLAPGQVVMVRVPRKPTEFPSLADLKVEIR